MIELKITGKCDGCPVAKLEVKGLTMTTKLGEFVSSDWFVECENRRLCDMLEQHLQKTTHKNT